MPVETAQNYMPLLPEIFLGIAAMALLMFGVFSKDQQSETPGWLAILILGVTGFLVANQDAVAVQLFDGAVIVDPFARFMKILILIASAFALVLSFDYLRDSGLLKFEFAVLVLLATLGMLLMTSANNLISLYLALETQSLAIYVLAAFRRDSVLSSEAGLKYFVLGALSSGLLLYGCSFVYGFTGTVSFEGIAAALQAVPDAASAAAGAGITAPAAPEAAATALQAGERSVGLIFGLVFILTAIAFKLSAVPFHMWTPDVYQGAPTPVTAFLSAGPKIAAFAMLIRALQEAFPSISADWQQIIIAISVASMVLGAFAAIGQRNIKRLMAYSSIGHVGYAMVGLAAAIPQGADNADAVEGVKGVMIYMAIYMAMTIGAFACILAMKRDGEQVEDISALSGLSRKQPMLAFMFALLLFSMAGIPPLLGFFAKWYVFLAAINADLYWLAVLGVVTSVIGAFYYLAVIAKMYFEEPAAEFQRVPMKLTFVLAVIGVVTLLGFVPLNLLDMAAEAAARSLF